MDSAVTTGGVYVLRVVCPNGDEIECDCAGFAGRLARVNAKHAADEFARELSAVKHHFGRPAAVQDAVETLKHLGYRPRECRVRVWEALARVCVYEVCVPARRSAG